jgi:hypothetical protein
VLAPGGRVAGLGPALGAALSFTYASRNGLRSAELQQLLQQEVETGLRRGSGTSTGPRMTSTRDDDEARAASFFK